MLQKKIKRKTKQKCHCVIDRISYINNASSDFLPILRPLSTFSKEKNCTQLLIYSFVLNAILHLLLCIYYVCLNQCSLVEMATVDSVVHNANTIKMNLDWIINITWLSGVRRYFIILDSEYISWFTSLCIHTNICTEYVQNHRNDRKLLWIIFFRITAQRKKCYSFQNNAEMLMLHNLLEGFFWLIAQHSTKQLNILH